MGLFYFKNEKLQHWGGRDWDEIKTKFLGYIYNNGFQIDI